jgi:Tol biopolymer transport system component
MLGTLGYMAPEQVRGAPVDYRADTFAFGAILYEMLAGVRAFGGDTPADMIAAILDREPPELPERAIPAALGRIVSRCLAKNPAERFQSTRDLVFALEALASPSDVGRRPASKGERKGTRRRRAAWVAAGMAGSAAAAAIVTLLLAPWRGAPEPRIYRASIAAPAGAAVTINPPVPPAVLALSPDGRHVVFSALGADQRRSLWLRSLDAADARPLAGTEGGEYPFWSPDSRFVAFVADGELRKMDIAGGPPLTIAAAPNGLDGAWGAGDVILLAARVGGQRVIGRVPAAGGELTAATMLDVGAGDARHTAPSFLPDGRHFLYLAIGSRAGGANDPRAVYVGSLDPGEPAKEVLQGGSNAKYANGHLLFLRRQSLMAQPFDLRSFEVTGEPFPLVQNLAIGGVTGQVGAFSPSADGVLSYVGAAPVNASELIWIDRAGRTIGSLGDRANYTDVELSPDGTRVALGVIDPARGTTDLWLFDVGRDVRTRFTFDPETERSPAWSPDGTRILFNAGRGSGSVDIYQKSSSGGGTEELLLASAGSKSPLSWSPDGRFVLYAEESAANGRDLWLLPLEDGAQPRPLLQTRFDEHFAKLSPDGRWMAYVSDESGRDEVYVVPLSGSGKWQISTTGGTMPRWRRDGREVFYLSPDGRLMAVGVGVAGEGFEVRGVTSLFQTRARRDGRFAYDVAPDGERFLVNSLLGDTGPVSAPIELVLNWPALLRND